MPNQPRTDQPVTSSDLKQVISAVDRLTAEVRRVGDRATHSSKRLTQAVKTVGELEPLTPRSEEPSAKVTKPVFVQVVTGAGTFSMTLDQKSITRFIRQREPVEGSEVETRIEFAPLDLVFEPTPE